MSISYITDSSANPLTSTNSALDVNIKSSNVTFGVSGTFWQATQPVSIASMPSTPVTGTFWQATQPVSIASMPSTPVTGTFWQAVQPTQDSDAGTLLGQILTNQTNGQEKVQVTNLPINKLTGAVNVQAQGAALETGNLAVAAAQLVSILSTMTNGGAKTAVSNLPVSQPVTFVQPGINPFLPKCNAVRVTNCQ